MRSINGEEYEHLFDGLALMQKLVIKSGCVTYTSRFLRSDSYIKNIKYNRIVVNEFGTNTYFSDPCKSLFEKMKSYFTLNDIFTDNDLVNFYFIGDQLYATSDSPYLRRIDLSTLETHERVDLNQVVGVATATSHPHTDSHGNTFNIGSNFGSYNITLFPPDGLQHGRVITQIATPRPLFPSYYHSFLMTEKYFIFIEQPLVISIPSVLYQNRIIRGVNSAILKWKPHLASRFYIIDRQSNQLIDQVYTANAFAFFHTINAYEKDGHLICDIVTYRDASFLKTLHFSAIKRATVDVKVRKSHAKWLHTKADRFVLPLIDKANRKLLPVGFNINRLAASNAVACLQSDGSIHCSPEHLTVEGETVAEMPTINYKYYNGKEYQYFYGFARCPITDSLGLMKVNTLTKKCITWFDPSFYPSEAVFVATQSTCSTSSSSSLPVEDDGVLLSLVINLHDETNGFLLVLNACNFTPLAKASFSTTHVIPPGFHGIFLPDQLDNSSPPAPSSFSSLSSSPPHKDERAHDAP